ncbi:hypothetical protein GIB67_014737 [Kingdonia uniflora]|uniref:Uncharacterized protein n=1 Tax=Kingdonia uniflora TaxID=39325 RepID=A0A7J7NV44_9MAGN|nr:hypothetical protein GIB67_014737 [Kingdonia uniflora]
MRPLGGEAAVKRAMWLYPKVLGYNPSERWGHSACFSNGLLYVFGGCCGGLHFSDVLTLNLDTMAWNTLGTTGQRPGARDSHSAVLMGQKMIVLGGTNGSKKVSDLHMLDIKTKEWVNPKCDGTPPSPRESHTATIVGDEKLVIFGGSGEGEGNYLNDLHVLDLKAMRWISPEVKGTLPAPRDSHIAVAIGNKLLVYGGDCGDRYHGEVDILDMETMTWSRLAIHGSSPGVRAGHAAVNIGSKVYIIGGVGDKHYYNDVWVLDVNTCSWTQLEIRGQQPQGRFSHTAVVTDSDIAIYGGCGEDERPLNELVVLQLGAEHPNGRYNITLCKVFRNHCNQEKRKSSRGELTNSIVGIKGDANRKLPKQSSKQSLEKGSDNLHPKRKKSSESRASEVESEQEEHSLSLSQNSSPSQSDQEQTPITKLPTSSTMGFLKQRNQTARRSHPHIDRTHFIKRASHDTHLVSGENPRQLKPEQLLHVNGGCHEQRHQEPGLMHNFIGAEVRGNVDGAFDSGYLVTANVNGKILRGVLFTPGPGVVSRVLGNPQIPSYVRATQRPVSFTGQESGYHLQQAQPSSVMSAAPTSARGSLRHRSDLQDVVLTLGGPGNVHGGQ